MKKKEGKKERAATKLFFFPPSLWWPERGKKGKKEEGKGGGEKGGPWNLSLDKKRKKGGKKGEKSWTVYRGTDKREGSTRLITDISLISLLKGRNKQTLILFSLPIPKG